MVLDGKVILLTGGTGSMGRTFLRRALSGQAGKPKKIIVFSRDEAKQNTMRLEYLNRPRATDEVIYQNAKDILAFRIGDVRNYSDVVQALRGVDIVVNAAALKQVPTCEYFPEQALLTNCVGAQNIVRAIAEHKLPIETVVGVSTDKACKPINVMGMTKALQERIFITANLSAPWTRFVCVRYGNVLASRGSVVPLFHEQIRLGGPITITDQKMTRFLLDLEQAVDTVLAAIKDAKPGETFVPLVPSANIVNVARALVGNRKIEIKITGIRPGEKLHEALIGAEEAFRAYQVGSYYALRPMLPELVQSGVGGSALEGEYSSEFHVVGLTETAELLDRHGLLDSEEAAQTIHRQAG